MIASSRYSGAWVFLAVGSVTQYGGNAGYDDEPSSYYSWDSTVPQSAKPRRGDRIALRDKKVLLGTSIIETIEQRKGIKDLYRCPNCDRGTISHRRTKTPPYSCNGTGGCRYEFDEPTVERKSVNTYRSLHSVGWTDLSGALTAGEVKALCNKPQSQHAIQPLDWISLVRLVEDLKGDAVLDNTHQRDAVIRGGHMDRTVRVRIGQGQFRRDLLKRYGEVCAFTGPGPETALHAAHLVSFAATGEHDTRKGLMLRSDIHVLFDAGYLAVNPRTMLIDVAPSIAAYEAYGQLNGRALYPSVGNPVRRLLEMHWQQHRHSQPV